MMHPALLLILSCSLLCFQTSWATDAWESEIVDKNTYLEEIVELLEQKWPQNRTINIVCHGHSVPAGYFKTPMVDTFNAYPHLLHRELKQRFPHAVINVIVTSIGGESSDRGAARFTRDVITHRPDVVIIDYALNDRRIGLDAAKAAHSSMIDDAKAKGIKIILLTPTADLTAEKGNPADPLNQHAQQIRSLAQKHQVGLADSLAAFYTAAEKNGNVADLMSQRNHPNRRGHELVAKELIQWFPN